MYSMEPNLMGRTTGFKITTKGPNDADWVERGEYADFSHRDSWPVAVSSKNTWEKRGHAVQIWEIDRCSGTLVYETRHAN